MNLALGTAQFGQTYGVANHTGKISIPEATAIIDYCRRENINLIDTAIDYGSSETCLGIIGVEEFDVITKIPPIPRTCQDVDFWVKDQIQSSIARLNKETLYGVMLHQPQQLFGKFGSKLLESLTHLKRLDKIKKLGISIYNPHELTSILSLYEFDIVQAPFNLIDQRLVLTGWLEKLRKKNIEIHCRSCFLQGLLLMPRDKIPKKFNSWSVIWDEWHSWLEKFKPISAIDACLGFVNSYKDIDKIVFGVDNLYQLKQIVSSSKKDINTKFFPNISCEESLLIDPFNWKNL
tara:strand:+ start:5656 stop:6528 length:873 start_codon:yes stop_codon:yes gene_type:complete